MPSNANVKYLTSKALEYASPNELLLVEYFDPARKNDGSTAKGPQGFGAADAIVLFLPYFYTFFQSYVEALGSEAGKISLNKVHSWLSRPSEQSFQSARLQVRDALEKQGLKADALDKAADAVMRALDKKHDEA